MASLTSASIPSPALKRGARSGIGAEIKSFWQAFFASAFSPYRPELHYMRGPGPAWRAKYGSEAAFRLKSDLD
jgi:hypothetical protein